MQAVSSARNATLGPPAWASPSSLFGAQRVLLTLPEFLIQSSVWVEQVDLLNQLLAGVCNSLEEAFRRDDFEVGERSPPSLLRGATAFGRRIALRVKHPLFGWCEVQARLTVHWPAGAELTLVAFPEVDSPVRPRKLRDDCIAKRHLAHLTQTWAEVTAVEGCEHLHSWLAGLSGPIMGAIALFDEAEPFRTDVELALAP